MRHSTRVLLLTVFLVSGRSWASFGQTGNSELSELEINSGLRQGNVRLRPGELRRRRNSDSVAYLSHCRLRKRIHVLAELAQPPARKPETFSRLTS